MKKIFILCFILSSFIFANDQFNIIEDRIENQFIIEKIIDLENYNIDYDIDIYNNQMNIEIEIEGLKRPSLNFKTIENNIFKTVKNSKLQITDIYILIKYESLTGNEAILFNKTYLNI